LLAFFPFFSSFHLIDPSTHLSFDEVLANIPFLQNSIAQIGTGKEKKKKR